MPVAQEDDEYSFIHLISPSFWEKILALQSLADTWKCICTQPTAELLHWLAPTPPHLHKFYFICWSNFPVSVGCSSFCCVSLKPEPNTLQEALLLNKRRIRMLLHCEHDFHTWVLSENYKSALVIIGFLCCLPTRWQEHDQQDPAVAAGQGVVRADDLPCGRTGLCGRHAQRCRTGHSGHSRHLGHPGWRQRQSLR